MDLREQIKQKIEIEWMTWRDTKLLAHEDYIKKLEKKKYPFEIILKSKVFWIENNFPAILSTEIENLVIEQILDILKNHPDYTLDNIPPISPERILTQYKHYHDIKEHRPCEKAKMPNFIDKPYSELEMVKKQIFDEIAESEFLVKKIKWDHDCIKEMIDNNDFPTNNDGTLMTKDDCEKLLLDNVHLLNEHIQKQNERVKKLEDIQRKIYEERAKQPPPKLKVIHAQYN